LVVQSIFIFQKNKLEPSRKKGTFVGYSETLKAYKIYIPGQRFIEVSRDVTFHEEATFCCARELPCDTKEHEAPSLNLHIHLFQMCRGRRPQNL
jgi:hypothetical protein